VLEPRQIDAPALEADPFQLQQEALLQAGFPQQRDASAGPDYALPWQSGYFPQNSRYMA
jgi:hypothetical protein